MRVPKPKRPSPGNPLTVSLSTLILATLATTFGGPLPFLTLPTAQIPVCGPIWLQRVFAGVFSNTSIGTRIIGSLAKDNHEPGFYIGDSLPAHAIVRGSTAIGNSFGLFLRDAIGGMITHNTFSGNCAGVVALGDAPGPSSGWKILNNHADHNNRRCGPGEEGGVSGVGIGLSGVRRSTVANNTVRRNLPKHKSDLHGGILIVKGEGGTAPRKLRIVGNTVLHNRPADIFWDKSGSVHFAQNHCRRSKPKHICS